MVVRTLLIAIGAGVISSMSFAPVGLWFLAPISYALLFSILRKRNLPILSSFIFGFTSGLLVLSWSKTFVGVLPWIALSLLQALMMVPLGLTARFTKSIPAFICVLLFSEEIQARFPFGGFSWRRIAFSQIDSPYAPLTSLIGVIGLSLLTLAISSFFLSRSKLTFLILFVSVLYATFVTQESKAGPIFSVTAIQGGVPERGLEFNARAFEVLNNHIKATLQRTSRNEDVILWPENAIDIDPIRNGIARGKVSALQRQTEIPLIAGAIIEPKRLFNTTILFDEAGSAQSIYRKRYLTPFGEYIPLRTIAEFLSPHAMKVLDFSAGNQLVIHRVNNVPISSIICYEILNDGLVQEAAKSSEFLVVHTNSATFSGSAEGEQQQAITRLRAIETGREIVSISTTGPSSVINSRGVVLKELKDGEVGALSSDIRLDNSLTMPVRFGGWLTVGVLLLTLAWAVLSLRKREDWV